MGTTCALKLGTLPTSTNGVAKFAVIVDQGLTGVEAIENRASITSGDPDLCAGKQ